MEFKGELLCTVQCPPLPPHREFNSVLHCSLSLMSEVNLEGAWKKRTAGTGLSSKLRLCVSGIWAEKELGYRCFWVEN